MKSNDEDLDTDEAKEEEKDQLNSLIAYISEKANESQLVPFDPEPPRFYLTCMADYLANTVVGYDERN